MPSGGGGETVESQRCPKPTRLALSSSVVGVLPSPLPGPQAQSWGGGWDSAPPLGVGSCLRGAHDSGRQPWVGTVPRSLGLGVGLGAPVLGKDPLREAQTLLASRVPGEDLPLSGHLSQLPLLAPETEGVGDQY